MGEHTKISWTHHTWSPWIGCTEVSPGCTACYARELDKRHQYGGAVHWGAGVPRYRTKQWGQPLAWNKKAVSGERRTVFPSLCDPFDNEVPEEWRRDLWSLIATTPNLTWTLLTKRIGNAEKMLPVMSRSFGPFDPLPNVWIGASVVNQEEADRDIPKLLGVPAAKRFVSYEPALSAVDWTQACAQFRWTDKDGVTCCGMLRNLDQIIVGGESSQGKHKARPFDLDWARSTVKQCKEAGVAVFVKQLGSHPLVVPPGKRAPFEPPGMKWKLLLRNRAGADPSEWPPELRIQEWPA